MAFTDMIKRESKSPGGGCNPTFSKEQSQGFLLAKEKLRGERFQIGRKPDRCDFES